MKLKMRLFSSILLISLFLSLNGFLIAQSNGYKKMPFYLDNDQIVLEGTLKGQPIKLALSTKFPSSIDFQKFSKKLRKSLLKSKEKEELFITYTPVTVASGIKFGDVKINRLKMFFDGLAKIPHTTSVELDGVLGHNFFKNRIIQIDYEDKIIRVFKKNPYKDLLKSKAKSNKAISIINLKINKPYLPYKSSFVVTKNIKLRKIDLDILIDLNQKSEFTLDESFRPNLNNSKILKNFRLGTFTFDKFETEFVQSYKYQETHKAALGSKFFQNFILTLDYKKKVMVLEKTK